MSTDLARVPDFKGTKKLLEIVPALPGDHEAIGFERIVRLQVGRVLRLFPLPLRVCLFRTDGRR